MKTKYFLITFTVLFVFYWLVFFLRIELEIVSSLRMIALIIAVISLFIYFIIRIVQNKHLGFKRLSIIIGSVFGVVLSIIVISITDTFNGVGNTLLTILFTSIIGSSVGFFIAEIIQWIAKGFKNTDVKSKE